MATAAASLRDTHEQAPPPSATLLCGIPGRPNKEERPKNEVSCLGSGKHFIQKALSENRRECVPLCPRHWHPLVCILGSCR